MNTDKVNKLKQGDKIFYGGGFYEVAETKELPHGLMVGIYDEPPKKHIDYLQPENIMEVVPCYACQGGGCPVCGGYGKLTQN